MSDNSDVGVVLIVLIVLAFAFMIGGILGSSIGSKTIKSKVLLEPRIELIIVDNKVDTIYVYEKRQSK